MQPGTEALERTLPNRAVCAACAALCFFAVPAIGLGDALLSYLSSYTVDSAALPMDAPADGGLALSAGTSIGQTFRLSHGAASIGAVEVALRPAAGDVAAGAAVKLTLWDGPARMRAIASDTRRPESTTLFRLETPVESTGPYYWELTTSDVEGPVAVLPKVVSYEGGRAYLSGTPQEYDVPFRVLVRRNERSPSQKLVDLLSVFDASNEGMARAVSAAEAGDPDAGLTEAAAAIAAAVAIPGAGPQGGGPDAAEAALARLTRPDRPNAPADDWADIHALAQVACAESPEYADAMAGSLSRHLPRMTPPDPDATAGVWSESAVMGRLSRGRDVIAALRGRPEAALMAMHHLSTCAELVSFKLAHGSARPGAAKMLLSFALDNPIFAESGSWVDGAVEAEAARTLAAALADGSPAGGDSARAIAACTSFLDLVEIGQSKGRQLGGDALKPLQRLLDFCCLAAAPDGSLPSVGESPRIDTVPLAERAGRLLGRADLLWIGTRGAEGTPPQRSSLAFPEGGWYCMRAPWPPAGTDAGAMPYALLRGGVGARGHHDLFSMVLHYGGRELLVDPGPGSEGARSATRTIAHSTLAVDGADQAPAGDVTVHCAVLLPSVDFIDISAQTYPLLVHRRCVAYIKPDMWVVADTVSLQPQEPPPPPSETANVAASAAAERVFTQVWRLPENSATLQGEGNLGRTTFPAGANLALIPVLEDGLSASVAAGSAVQYSRRGVAGADFATLLVPFTDSALPAAAVSADTGDGEGLLISIATPGSSHRVVLFGDPAKETTFAGGSLKMAGAACHISGSGPEQRFAAASCRRLEADGVVLAEADEPIGALQVTYSQDAVSVVVQGGHPSLRVATLGRTKLAVPGGLVYDIPATQDHVSPITP